MKYALDKAAYITTKPSKLMANVGGPTASKRRLLMLVMESILLCDCEIWTDSLKTEKYRKHTASAQGRGALRVASSYRTVPEPVVFVIAGVVPIGLLALERIDAAKHEVRELTLLDWKDH